MANQVDKFNTIAITDIEKINALDDDAIDKLNGLTFAGVVQNPWQGARAILAGGYGDNPDTSATVLSDTIEYWTIASANDSQDFGDLTYKHQTNHGGASNRTTGLFMGGYDTSGYSGNIDRVANIASTANANDFGDLSNSEETYGNNVVSNGTLGMRMGGKVSGGYTDTCDIVTISAGGSSNTASDHGDLYYDTYSGGCLSGSTRAMSLGGYSGDNGGNAIDMIQYKLFASTATGTDYGNLRQSNLRTTQGVEDASRGVVAGGYEDSGAGALASIQHFSIEGETAGFTATDSSMDLSEASFFGGGISDGTYGVIVAASADNDSTDKITIQSLGGTASDTANLKIEGNAYARDGCSGSS